MMKQIFVTGAPGSKWSGYAKTIPDQDMSGHTPERTYKHSKYGGHDGVYFGTGMEFPPAMSMIDDPFWGTGTRVYKSHEWVYNLTEINEWYPDAEIHFVYRRDDLCFDWWKEAGGWDITYPNYDWYEDDELMKGRIKQQNALALDFVQKHSLGWNNLDNDTFLAVYNG